MEQLTLLEDIKTRFDYKSELFENVGNVKPKRTYKSLETFAGAGGLALGLEKAGFHAQAVVEIDKDAAQTMRDNRKSWNVVETDINDYVENLNAGEFENIDLLSGGFPCQAFSYAGKREGFEDTRGTLFYPFSKLIEKLQPKVFLAENVRGLVNHDKGRTLETMIDVFEELGYNVQWRVLNAWGYQTAQKRERIFIVGIRNDIHEKETRPFTYPKEYDYKPVLKDILKDVPSSEGVEYSENKKRVMALVPAGGSWVDLPEDVARDYMGKSYFSGGGKRGMARRISWEEPSLTLTTSPSQKQTERCHPEETRPFTVREYARIQGFPDDWMFSGGVGAKYRQIGNAVPVNLAKNVGLSIINYLNQFED